MAMIKCKGCKDRTPEHDTLEGYCMLCAAQRIRWVATLRTRIDQLEYQEICEKCSAKTEIGCNASKRIKELEKRIEVMQQNRDSIYNQNVRSYNRIKELEAVLDALHFCRCGCSDDNIKAVEQALKSGK